MPETPETPGNTAVTGERDGGALLAELLTDIRDSLVRLEGAAGRIEAAAAEFLPPMREALPALRHLLHKPRRTAAAAWMRGNPTDGR
jgi:hypothetical protein